jgi:hypothetical protein
VIGDWSRAELEALEAGADPVAVAKIRAARETGRAGKVPPSEVRFGQSTGMSRCGLCRHYQPDPSNSMFGTCDAVDVPRVERNQWCELFEPSAPSTAGSPGGAAALTSAEIYSYFTGRDLEEDTLLWSVPHHREGHPVTCYFTGEQWDTYLEWNALCDESERKYGHLPSMAAMRNTWRRIF